ncbi:FecCD family ABC transporter permease [Pseudorhodobacter aquimaris]|uniref:FecCD family ABC transporter permease n=1 Tax=Pseudorhodobacter aquimaris TaxID=687412 RepID=UPI00067B7BD5|nr:iron ABC transporter permease [Pseudorhodobacter aquimaris]
MTGNRQDALGLLLLSAGLLTLLVWGLTVGTSDISLADAWHALWSDTDQREEIVVQDVRLPRLLAAIVVGAALAAAGTIMQAVTGNPMADPGLLGVNAGASFAVVLAIALGGVSGAQNLVWFAFLGAGGAAALVYLLGGAGRSGTTPVKLILAGVVVASFLGALTMSILVVDMQTFDEVRLWTAGSLKGRDMQGVLLLAPYAGVSLIGAIVLRQQFNALALGSDTAGSLGQNQPLWLAISALLVVGLAGSAVALAGPIGFVGLVVPHLVRMSIGSNYARILPFACLVGAGLTLLADTLPRAIFARDVPVGISLAAIGAPFFIWLARRERAART